MINRTGNYFNDSVFSHKTDSGYIVVNKLWVENVFTVNMRLFVAERNITIYSDFIFPSATPCLN